MYTVEIGQQFLNFYNQKTGNDYSAIEFFDEEFFPVVFECDDKKQLYPFIHNSPFHQPSYSGIAKKENIRVSEYRKEKFYEDLELVPKGEKSLSHSKLIGAKSGKNFDIPSGQVSNIDMEISKDKMIYSWIGGAFGIAFKGGYDILIDNNELNWHIFSGWEYYRKFIEQTPNVKARQLTDWNANWIYYGGNQKGKLDRSFTETVRGINEDNSKSKNIRIRKIEWSKIIFAITKFFNKRKRILAYAYKFGFGQSFNRTLGFFPIQFSQISSWYELFEQHLEAEADISSEGWVALMEVYQSEFNLVKAFMRGGIGIKALRPKGLFQYASKKKLSKKDAKKKIQFIIFKTWLIAMLNKKEILEIADKLAGVLYQYSTSNERGKTTKGRDVDKLWEAKNLNTFVDLLTVITEKSEETDIFKEVVNTVVLDLPEDRFRLFITLTKFNYKTY